MPPRKPAVKVEKPTPRNVVLWFKEWVGLKSQTDAIAKRQKELRDRLCGAIETEGYADDKGNIFLELDEEIEGFGGLKYERRVSQSLNEERAIALVKARKLEKRCIVMVPTLDQEEIFKAHYDGLITQDELDSIFDTSENFAFKQTRS